VVCNGVSSFTKSAEGHQRTVLLDKELV